MTPMIGSIILWPGTSALTPASTLAQIAPRGWAFCDGKLLPIAQYRLLFSIIGNTYGGGGDTFALPDLRAQAPPNTSYLIMITTDDFSAAE